MQTPWAQATHLISRVLNGAALGPLERRSLDTRGVQGEDQEPSLCLGGHTVFMEHLKER
jgi:hypothetical protein